jgi:hypothetical protein
MVTGIQIDILFGGLHRCAIKEPEFAFSQPSLLSVGLKQISNSAVRLHRLGNDC